MRECTRRDGRCDGRRRVEAYSEPDAVGWRANRTAASSTFDSNLSAMMDASQRAGCRVLESLVARLGDAVPDVPGASAPAIDCATFYAAVDAKASDFRRVLASILGALGGVPPDAAAQGSAALAEAASQLVKRAVGPLCGEDSSVSPAALRARLEQVGLAYCAAAPEAEAALPAGLLHRPVVLRAALDASTSRFLAATPAGRVVAADPMDATALMRWVVRPVSDGAAEYTLELDAPTAAGRFLAAGRACADDGLSLAPSDAPEEGLQRWKVVRLRDRGAGAYALRAAHRGSCGADVGLERAGARPALWSGTPQAWLVQLSGSTRRASEGMPFNYVRPLTRDANASLVFAQPGGALPPPLPLAAPTALGGLAGAASSRPPSSDDAALEEDVFLPLGAPVTREAVGTPPPRQQRQQQARSTRSWAWAWALAAALALALAWWWRRRRSADADLLQQLNAEIATGA